MVLNGPLIRPRLLSLVFPLWRRLGVIGVGLLLFSLTSVPGLPTPAAELGNAEAHFERGIRHYQMGELQQAADEFKTCLKLNPLEPDAHNNLGTVLAQTGHFTEAIPEFVAELNRDPQTLKAGRIHHNLGSALLALGRVNDAIPHFQRAIFLDPHLSEAHLSLAEGLHQIRQDQRAIGVLQELIRLDPENPQAYHDLGLLWRRRDPRRAIQALQTAVSLNSSWAIAHNHLGIVLAEAGRLNAAIEAFQQAVRLDPMLLQAYDNLDLALDRVAGAWRTEVVG